MNEMVPPKTSIDIAAWAHVIKHGDTWMMFDTQHQRRATRDPRRMGHRHQVDQDREADAHPQLKAIGITPDDIKLIGISHNHADPHGQCRARSRTPRC